jgi:hypothetical protein
MLLIDRHDPEMHVSPRPRLQRTPHPPQLLASVVTFTQLPPHRCRFKLQTQDPDEQCSPKLQSTPQPPQLLSSVARS